MGYRDRDERVDKMRTKDLLGLEVRERAYYGLMCCKKTANNVGNEDVVCRRCPYFRLKEKYGDRTCLRSMLEDIEDAYVNRMRGKPRLLSMKEAEKAQLVYLEFKDVDRFYCCVRYPDNRWEKRLDDMVPKELREKLAITTRKLVTKDLWDQYCVTFRVWSGCPETSQSEWRVRHITGVMIMPDGSLKEITKEDEADGTV